MLPPYYRRGGMDVTRARLTEIPASPIVKTEDAYVRTLDFLSGEWTSASLRKICGRTLVFRQLINNGNFASTTGWNFNSSNVAFSVSDNVATLTANSAGTDRYCVRTITSFIKDHIYFWSVGVWTDTAVADEHKTDLDYNAFRAAFGGSGSIVSYIPTVANRWVTARGIMKAQATGTNGWVRMYTNQAGVTHKYRNMMVIDLTSLYGPGKEPTDPIDVLGVLPDAWYDYDEGTLDSAAVNAVTSADVSGGTVAKFTVPADVQALTGYGLSTYAACNYIDLVNGTYVQEVASRAYTAGDESDATMVTDGTTTCYPLVSAVTTSISSYLDGSHILRIAPPGTLTFENSVAAGGHILMPVPATVAYSR